MNKDRFGVVRWGGLMAIVGAVAWLLIAPPSCDSQAPRDTRTPRQKEEETRRLEARYGKVETSVKSKFSNIRIRKLKNTFTMMFIRDNGEEVLESRVNLDRPNQLLVDYTRYMFLSYLFKPKQEKVLICGLGGGGMVHFMKHYDPKCKVDCVEIDPEVVRLAAEYFGVTSGGNVNIITKDAFDHFKAAPDGGYDVIYMDAFLKPSGATDETGAPLRLKTVAFYKDLQKKLTADGVVVFNINPHKKIMQDVRNIQEAFPQAYIFELPDEGGLVAVGTKSSKRLSGEQLFEIANGVDRRFEATFSFRLMALHLQ
jgi:spermidine synthase